MGFGKLRGWEDRAIWEQRAMYILLREIDYQTDTIKAGVAIKNALWGPGTWLKDNTQALHV